MVLSYQIMEDWAINEPVTGVNIMERYIYDNFIVNTRLCGPLGNSRGEIQNKVQMNLTARSVSIHVEKYKWYYLLFQMLFITIEGVYLLPDNGLVLQLTDITNFIHFKFWAVSLLTIFSKLEYVFNTLNNAAIYCLNLTSVVRFLYHLILCIRWRSKLTLDFNSRNLFQVALVDVLYNRTGHINIT